jgi:hypothetical protein
MLEVRVRVDLGPAQRWLDQNYKQVKFASAVALTRTAYKVVSAEGDEMQRVLDRPRPQTVRALLVRRATRDNQTAIVSLKTRSAGIPAAEYLEADILGGRRALKRSELMLQAVGILPQGMQTAPGKGADLDAYGNMSRGQMAQILSYFRTYGSTPLNSPRMNMTSARAAKLRRTKSYFVISADGKKTKLAPGIWMRDATGSIKPILMFIRPGSYKRIFDFERVGVTAANASFADEFNRAFVDAMRTAR